MQIIIFLLSLFLVNSISSHYHPASKTSTIPMKGRYTWVLLWNIDNSFNSASIRRQVEIKSSVVASYNQMKRSIQETLIGSSVESSISGTVFEVVDVRVKGELRNEIKSSYESLSETKREYRHEFTRTDTYEVGPYSKLTLYVLHFTGPGISYQTDTVSTSPEPLSEVNIDLTVKTRLFLKDIDVIYTGDSASRPRDTISMAKGNDPNVNAGFRGQHVWLVPKWTDQVREAVTGISIAFQKGANGNFKDLAKGAGGLFRYVILQKDPRSRRRITDVGLYRTGKDWNGDNPIRSGWDFATEDINKGRKGDFLYLVWNTDQV